MNTKSRETLRKVQYHDSISGRDENAYFHQWGNINYDDDYPSVVQTKAIIELEDGEVILVDPPRICFVGGFAG